LNLVDALRLIPGDRIEYAGDVRETAEWSVKYSGTVVRVTKQGGILIDDDEPGYGRHFVGYYCVRAVTHVRRRPNGRKPRHDERAVREMIRRVALTLGRDECAAMLAETAQIDHVKEMMPQDHDPIFEACERMLRAHEEAIEAMM
jgi:hypothetical protein